MIESTDGEFESDLLQNRRSVDELDNPIQNIHISIVTIPMHHTAAMEVIGSVEIWESNTKSTHPSQGPLRFPSLATLQD